MSKQSGFWEFSLRHYGHENIGQNCLQLQNELNADVNMLLFCCWFGCNKGFISDELLLKVFEFSEAWQQHVVLPLRSGRQWMKHAPLDMRELTSESEKLREAIKQTEFSAEKIQQHMLESISADHLFKQLDTKNKTQACIANLKAYIYLCNKPIKGKTYLGIRKSLIAIINSILSLPDDNMVSESEFDD